MKRRAFLEERDNRIYLDDFVYISWFPLYDRGFEIVNFNGDDLENSLFKYNPTDEDVIVGSVEATIAFFNYVNIEVPKYLGYPEELKPFLKRNVKIKRYGDIKSLFPFFIKPANDVKLFTGVLIESPSTEKFLKDYDGLTDDTMVWYSQPMNFVSEYRCFVHFNQIVGIKHYTGDFMKFPDVEAIKQMVDVYKTSNCSYTLDVGINDFGETVLVEVNDMWAIGSYGLDGRTYARLLVDRFQQLKYDKIKNE